MGFLRWLQKHHENVTRKRQLKVDRQRLKIEKRQAKAARRQAGRARQPER